MMEDNEENLVNTNLKVVGLNCESCVKHTEEALRSTNGIKQATVDLNSESADIIYDPSAVDLTTIRKAVQDVGYDLILPEEERQKERS